MNIYYVYVYYHPISHIPFYVGYGKNNRHLSHLKEAQRKPTPKLGEHKLNTIRKIIKDGLEPIIEIVDKNLPKNTACELEELLISFIGRRDNQSGTLTNHTMGGDGNRDWSPSLRCKMSEQRRNMISAKDQVTGKKLRIHNTDPRWLSGELVGQNLGVVDSNKNGKLTGYIQAKDPITGICFRVKSDDTRWVSGELVGVNKGKPAHPNAISASKSQIGIPKSSDHNKKVSDTMKLLKWYCDFETNIVGRFKEGEQPSTFVRVSVPHKRTPI